MTLRDVVHGNSQQLRLIEVSDPGVALDMDTPSDYQIMLERFAGLVGGRGSNAAPWM
jgi:CTP:molybdopterin cytidylyltransferase MocA